MEISVKSRERFCKDCNIPIRIFQEPYFTDRLKLFDKFYGTIEKWNLFVKELQKYNCEQDYFEEYNRVKDKAISAIKNSEAYQKFNEEDMNKFSVTYKNLPNKDIFKPSNDGKTLISIDMRKANFSSLQYYGDTIGESMFAGASTWEDFIGLFTNNRHIIHSKYIRQVILGNCNPKKHITYEKYLMDIVLTILVQRQISIDRVVFFFNDEIVFDVSDINKSEQQLMTFQIENSTNNMDIPLKVELFKIHKIYGTDGYYKEILEKNGIKKIQFKCLDNYILPFVIRHFMGEEVIESDKVFYHEGLLSKFIEAPNIEFVFSDK